MSADPWTVAAAIYPGAFPPHERDRQAEQGRGDWPAVAVAWRPPPLQRHVIAASYVQQLRVLELRPSLWWSYADAEVVSLGVDAGRGSPRVQDILVAQARRQGLLYWSTGLRQGSASVQLHAIRRAGARGPIAPDLEAVLRLMREGVLPEPARPSDAARVLDRHQRREERIAASPAGQVGLFGVVL